MDQSAHNPGELAQGQPQITRLEHASSGDRQAAIFSVDFGDGLPCGALVMFIARAQGIRVVEVYNHSSGDAEAPLRRALNAYTGAVEAITAAGGELALSGFARDGLRVPA